MQQQTAETKIALCKMKLFFYGSSNTAVRQLQWVCGVRGNPLPNPLLSDCEAISTFNVYKEYIIIYYALRYVFPF